MPATSSFVLRCAAVVLAAVLLAGCTGEAAPSPTPAPTTPAASAPAASGSPSKVPTASSTKEPDIEKITTPPAVPVDLTTPGKVGSKAAVEYFVALYGYTLNTGDTSLLREASTSTCEYCLDLAEGIELDQVTGLQRQGGGATIEGLNLYEAESSANRHFWIVRVLLGPERTRTASGEVTELPESHDRSGLVASWDGASWKVAASHDVRDLAESGQ